jgi:hypothetical protein
MTNLKTKVLEIVKNKDIRMIPKWKFILYSSFLFLSIVLLFLLASFVLSLIFFVLSRYGFMHMPFFGFGAMMGAFSAIPLMLFIVVVILLAIIEVLSRHYSFTFRKPVAVTLLAITFCVAVISFMVSETTFHESIYHFSRNHHIDMMTHAYDRPRSLEDGGNITVLRGDVIATTTMSVTVQAFDGSTTTFVRSSSTERFIIPDLDEDVVGIGILKGSVLEVKNMRTTNEMPHFMFHEMRRANGLPNTRHMYFDGNHAPVVK